KNLSISNPPFPHGEANGYSLLAQTVSSFSTDMKTPTIIQYNVEIQRQILPTLSVRAAYVGSYGYNMMRLAQLNLRIPAICQNGLLVGCPGLANATQLFPATGDLRNPSFADIGRMLSDSNFNYNGLQAALQKNLSAGLRIQASYTYSKALADTDQV